MKINSIISYTQIPLEVCTPEKHFANAYQKQYFAKFRLANLYCINSDFWEQNPPVNYLVNIFYRYFKGILRQINLQS